MSLNDIISQELAGKLAELSVGEIAAIIKAASVGFGPERLKVGAGSISSGDDVPLPDGLGQARPVTIVAWSFVSDHGQYAGVYGVSVAKAAELKHQLRTDPGPAVEEIRGIVSAHFAKKGSHKAIYVSSDGIPGIAPADHPPSRSRGAVADLKREIAKDGALYGMYRFEAFDTGRPGGQHFAVPLGAGLNAVFANKSGAVDVARLCRKLGRKDPLVSDYVAFWPKGKSPVFGSDIPEKVTFDGRLRPGEQAPAEPVARDKTAVPPGGASSA